MIIQRSFFIRLLIVCFDTLIELPSETILIGIFHWYILIHSYRSFKKLYSGLDRLRIADADISKELCTGLDRLRIVDTDLSIKLCTGLDRLRIADAELSKNLCTGLDRLRIADADLPKTSCTGLDRLRIADTDLSKKLCTGLDRLRIADADLPKNLCRFTISTYSMGAFIQNIISFAVRKEMMHILIEKYVFFFRSETMHI